MSDGTGRRSYEGRSITVSFDAGLCEHSAVCVRGLPEVFDTGRRPWISPDGADAEQVAAVVRRCPSGALRYEHPEGGRGTGPLPSGR
ncbi:(4Fe-4S)-binding protein [Streptomyces sp. NPDC012600]|uniref:(4Fe-4S)-binding protein n=1 Tax=Streptomyces stephensoniae TaxID=3375367 RepID=A0ABU2VWB5_9ACTN|nr:(4Fe-4S)-binding protein [Streptomyces griseus]MDT0489881.1 (4Fe-4S)-binding protein [Streptomyces griseus]